MELSPGNQELSEHIAREKRAAQKANNRDLQKSPFTYSAKYYCSECAYEATTQNQGKNHLTGLNGIDPGTHTRLGIVPGPTN